MATLLHNLLTLPNFPISCLKNFSTQTAPIIRCESSDGPMSVWAALLLVVEEDEVDHHVRSTIASERSCQKQAGPAPDNGPKGQCYVMATISVEDFVTRPFL